jgi:lysozyme
VGRKGFASKLVKIKKILLAKTMNNLLLKINGAKNKTAPYKKKIAELNQRLVWWGVMGENERNDVFSNKTLEAVKLFQEKKGLLVDGIVGKNTWAELLRPSDEEVVEIINQEQCNICPTPPIIFNNNEDLSYGFELIKYFEGLVLTVYPDPLTLGKPYTVGYGSTRTLDGREWVLGQKITKQEAEDLLVIEAVEKFLPKLRKIPYWEEMSAYQHGALLSFAWNLGADFYGAKGFETITKCLKNKEWAMVPKALVLYRNPGTNVERGLKIRRQTEGQLWSKKDN